MSSGMRIHAVRRSWAVCSQLLCLLCRRYRDLRICPQAALADLAVATFHRGIKLEDLANYIVAAPSMQGNQPMSGETLNVHLRQAFDLAGEPVRLCRSIWTRLWVTSVACYIAGVPCGRLDGYSTKGKSATNSTSMVWRRRRAWASTKQRSRWRQGRQLRPCCAL